MDSRKDKAIALCRVSTDEQLKNNSLNRQAEAVEMIAEKFKLEIVKTWSGSVSSKSGKNLARKDLNEMLAYCKKNKQIKYVVVDEPDRFMRSLDEGLWYIVEFKRVGVRVLFSDDKLNGEDATAKLMCSFGLFNGEISNEERARKTKHGHEKAIRDGRYTFVPPLGYIRGKVRGIPEIDRVIGPLLKAQLLRIANKLVSPTVALQDYNRSVETAGLKKAPLKMDKWRAICTNPFYCGVIEMNKIVKASNPNGLHEKLISKEQHERILEAFNRRPKNQKGPNFAGNPLYPFNQMITHVGCPCTKSKYNTFVGVTVKNSQGKEYEKYRCRGCYMYVSREEMRERIEDIISSLELTESGSRAVRDALINVFEMEEGDITSRQTQLYSQRANAKREAESVRDAFIGAREQTIRDSLEEKHKELTNRIRKYDEEINELGNFEADEIRRFCEYAFNFISDLVRNILNLPPKEMQLCKQLLFPDGFCVDENKNVYTTKISPIYRLKSIKKDSDESSDSLVVRAKRL
ncbi:recombinase family protein [Candidatus Saccharibacteria bacterium]|nr:recombinase family protein [Candidatus Saccharibacteria bacterium]